MKSQGDLSLNFIIQYSIVGLILLIALVWICWKIFRNSKKRNNACCGCTLSETCEKKLIKNKNGNLKNL